MATETKTKTFYPGEHEDFNSGDNTSISNPMNPVGKGTDNNTCAYISAYLTTAYAYWPFDVSIIPDNATIDSVECKAKVSLSHDSLCDGKIQLFSGDIAKGEAASINPRFSNPSVYKLSIETWTRSELNSVRLKTSIKSTKANRRSILIYGADLTVTYTYNSEKFMLKTGGAWADVARVFKKVSGIWVEQTDLANVIEDGVRYQNGGEIESTGPKAIPVTITGTGSAKYCFATINGTEYASAASGIEVMPGDTVRFTVWGEPPETYITINGTKVQTGSVLNATSYDWTIPDGVSSISIKLYDDGSTTARITVTAQ